MATGSSSTRPRWQHHKEAIPELRATRHGGRRIQLAQVARAQCPSNWLAHNSMTLYGMKGAPAVDHPCAPETCKWTVVVLSFSACPRSVVGVKSICGQSGAVLGSIWGRARADLGAIRADLRPRCVPGQSSSGSRYRISRVAHARPGVTGLRDRPRHRQGVVGDPRRDGLPRLNRVPRAVWTLHWHPPPHPLGLSGAGTSPAPANCRTPRPCRGCGRLPKPWQASCRAAALPSRRCRPSSSEVSPAAQTSCTPTHHGLWGR